MERIRNWLLPALLAIQQLAFWPGRPLRDGDPVGAAQLAAGLGAAVVITAALGVRRRRPVAAALTVEAVLLACVPLPLPDDATLLHAFSVLVALYSVAVRSPARRTALVGSALAVAEAVRAALQLDSAADVGGEILVNCALFLTVVGLGRGRRRWQAGRRAAARDLARAEAERGRAATTERRRLARELHDVSAHHLTSVVVTADAALRLGDRKPELTAQALEFAADGGRETLASLDRLVAMMRTSAADEDSALEERVDELAAGFARLGLRPAVDVAPDLAGLTGPVAEAAFGIVREALTNALRYAPGAAVLVSVAVSGGDGDGAVDLTVEDDGARGAAGSGAGSGAGQRLGSGRGTVGMRERATALDGTLDAGPRKDGPGWRVRARLPLGTAALRGPASRHPALRGLDATDGATVLSVAAIPVFAVLVERPADVWLSCVPALAYTLPLLWRRRAPWAVLCAVLALAWLAPLGLAFGLLHRDVALTLTVTCGAATCVALYAVAAYAGPARVTWPASGVAAAGLTLSAIALAAADGISDLEGQGGYGLLLFLVCMVGTLFLFPLAALWGVGAVVRTRRDRIRAIEDHVLAETVRSAVVEAYEERRRIAAELRGEVLRHAADVVAHAEAGDLKSVADGARAALAAMRDLLAALREVTGPTAPETSPTPVPTRSAPPKEAPPSPPRPPSLPRTRTAKAAPATAPTALEPSE
ncbi:sensor histidine kinase [Streptomyces sp. NPDC059002]|uniref:sensor histidine kinase n=1 Tax=Streptomyces sp. NPDC059002 TaxID=3346690 RepID=UPI0036AC2C0B